jgi:hypothetical protein
MAETSASTSDTYTITSFSQFLQALADGRTHHELTKAIPDIIAELNNARAEGVAKPGASITLTIKLTLDGEMVDVVPNVKIVTPTLAQPRSSFWTTPKNQLTRANPKQQDLPLRDVNTGRSEVKTV